MTLPTTEIESGFTPRDSYLKMVPLIEDTLARAGDANQIQQNVEDALALFGGDVDAALRLLTLNVTSKILALERRQDAFEDSVQATISDFRAEIFEALAALRIYADSSANTALLAAKRYTDDEIAKLRGVLVDATGTVIVVPSQTLDDGGNYFGGKTWDIPVMYVPGGSTLYVHRWAFNWTATAHTGGAKDDVSVTWPNFLGYRAIGANATFDEDSGARAEQPMFTIHGPAAVAAQVYVNNVKGKCLFTIDGFLTPDPLGGG